MLYPVTDLDKSRMQENLKYIRISAGISSEQMAKLLGITRDTYSRVETGRNQLSTMMFLAITAIIEHLTTFNEYASLRTVYNVFMDGGKYDEYDRIQLRCRINRLLKGSGPRLGMASIKNKIDKEFENESKGVC